jgi:hypothetical protein
LEQFLVIWVASAFLFVVALVLRDFIETFRANLKARLHARRLRRLEAGHDPTGRGVRR